MSTPASPDRKSRPHLPAARANGALASVLYLLGGPLVWLGSLALLALAGLRGCAPLSLVLVIQFAALAGCALLMYHALRNVRRAVPGRTEGRRLPRPRAKTLTVPATTLPPPD